MANNTFKTAQYVLDDVFVRFWNSLQSIQTANRNLEQDFGKLQFATGQSLDYRLEERYLGGEGATANTESRVQVVRPLKIEKQFHTLVDYSGFDLTFNRARMDAYLEMSMAPRIKRLANKAEAFVVSSDEGLQKKTYQAVGTPGVATDFNTVLSGNRLMTELGIPQDGRRYGLVSPRTSQNLANDLHTVFNDRINTAALIDGFIGKLSNFNMLESNFLTRQVAGAGQSGGSPPSGFKLGGTVTNGPISSGNEIQLENLQANELVFRKGDSIEIDPDDGVFFVNPLTYDDLSQTAQFVVTQDVTSNGAGEATIKVEPEIVISGARQNLSGAIPNGAQLFLANDHNVDILYHSQAIVFAAPPLTPLRGGVEAVTRTSDLYKLSMTFSLGSDVRNYEQLDRIDLIAGRTINPEFAIRVRS